MTGLLTTHTPILTGQRSTKSYWIPPFPFNYANPASQITTDILLHRAVPKLLTWDPLSVGNPKARAMIIELAGASFIHRG